MVASWMSTVVHTGAMHNLKEGGEKTSTQCTCTSFVHNRKPGCVTLLYFYIDDTYYLLTQLECG